VVFCCSASEACISAVRYARCYTGKEKIAKFEGGYQGMGDEFMVSMHPCPELFPGAPAYPRAVPSSGGIAYHTLENVVILPQNDLASCKRILSQNAHSIACVIMELQTGAGGLIVLDQDFVEGIREMTADLGILLVVDETVTLRLAFHGLQSVYDVTPDLTVMGKMIGGGLPLGAVGGRDDLLRLNEEKAVYHSGTHHGHPLATAAGIATLEIMDEDSYNILNTRGEKLKEELNEWAAEKNYPFCVYGIGSHLEIDFPDRPGRCYSSCRDAATYSNETLIHTFALELANRDIFPMYRGQISLSLPMTDEDIALMVETSKQIVEDIFE
jgi:glutamate-1-semialdehyde 2,1-aminomutase